MKLKVLWKCLFALIAVVLLLTAILLCRSAITDKGLRDNLNSIYKNPDYTSALRLERFPVYRQPNAWSCGPATISMVYDYLKEQGNEKQALDESIFANRKTGMLPGTFEKYLKGCMKGYDVELRDNIPDSEVIATVYNQLKQGLPIPVYFSTVNDWDKPNYDTHYSAVIGIDLGKNTVTIANAYGFLEEVSINDFLGSLKYDNYRNKPFVLWFSTMTGIINKNNIYVLSKK